MEQELAALKESGLYINIRTIESAQGARLVVNGQDVLNFCSNNYLGLANHPRLCEAAKNAIDQYGVGPGAVRTIAGNMTLHDRLEARLAAFKGVEATIAVQSDDKLMLGGAFSLIDGVPFNRVARLICNTCNNLYKRI